MSDINLEEIWKLKTVGGNIIAENDLGCLKKNDVINLSYFYRTHIMPLPFMCNTENPNVLILALNPSYDPIKDEEDTSDINKNYDLDGYIKNLSKVDFFYNVENSKKIIGTNTFNWWKNRVFNNIELQKDKKIGIFNLCGYHSREYETIPKRFFNNSSYLPTQDKVKEYIKNLINNNDEKVIIIVWGKDEWSKYLDISKNELDERFIILNEHNGLNKSIYYYYKHKDTSQCIKNKLGNYFKILVK